MKIKYVNIIILIVAASLTGCLEREKGTLRIDSLSFYGNEFFCNQKIKMWMCVESDNLYIAEYDWGCEEGHFTEKLYSEACWVAPNKPGQYKVWCKVTIGKNTETRERIVNVSHYFFDYFKSSSIWTLSTGLERVLKVDDDGNNYGELKMNSNSLSSGALLYSFGDPNLKIPFGCRATIGHLSNMPTDFVTVGSSISANAITYTLSLSRDPNLLGLYVSQITFTWFPAGSESMPIDPVGSGENCNGNFFFVQSGSGPTSVVENVLFYHPALEFAEGEPKKVALNISADYIVTIYMAGEKVYETDALKTWRTDNSYAGAFHVNSWQITVPNGPGGTTNATTAALVPVFYLTNTIADNSGIIYTGAASELPNP